MRTVRMEPVCRALKTALTVYTLPNASSVSGVSIALKDSDWLVARIALDAVIVSGVLIVEIAPIVLRQSVSEIRNTILIINH